MIGKLVFVQAHRRIRADRPGRDWFHVVSSRVGGHRERRIRLFAADERSARRRVGSRSSCGDAMASRAAVSVAGRPPRHRPMAIGLVVAPDPLRTGHHSRSPGGATPSRLPALHRRRRLGAARRVRTHSKVRSRALRRRTTAEKAGDRGGAGSYSLSSPTVDSVRLPDVFRARDRRQREPDGA